MQCVTLSLFRFETPLSRGWALSMMAVSRAFLPGVRDLQFWKLCGTGSGEGFTPRINLKAVAILCTWPSEAIARARLRDARPFPWYRDRASEAWTVFLTPVSARGLWAGRAPFEPAADTLPGQPLAVLTRASVKPRRAMRFWRRVPAIVHRIGEDRSVLFRIGIGEVPFLHQVTFSIWPDAASMARFAHESGAHADAVRAVRSGDWFGEELYARFRVLDEDGSWSGRSGLSPGQSPAPDPALDPDPATPAPPPVPQTARSPKT